MLVRMRLPSADKRGYQKRGKLSWLADGMYKPKATANMANEKCHGVFVSDSFDSHRSRIAEDEERYESGSDYQVRFG